MPSVSLEKSTKKEILTKDYYICPLCNNELSKITPINGLSFSSGRFCLQRSIFGKRLDGSSISLEHYLIYDDQYLQTFCIPPYKINNYLNYSIIYMATVGYYSLIFKEFFKLSYPFPISNYNDTLQRIKNIAIFT